MLSPRGQSYGDGPNDFQINKTAEAAGIEPAKTGPSWRLTLSGGEQRDQLSREELLAMELRHRAAADRLRRGLDDLRDVDRRAAARARGEAAGFEKATVFVESLQEGGAFAQTTLNPARSTTSRSLLALQVNGADLSLDHGFPARVIVPALPGVHNTKWVSKMTFMEV